MEYIMVAETLAKYNINYYEALNHKAISPIKLQKSLYFTFAYRAGFVSKNTKKKKYVEEQIRLSPYLFEEEF